MIWYELIWYIMILDINPTSWHWNSLTVQFLELWPPSPGRCSSHSAVGDSHWVHSPRPTRGVSTEQGHGSCWSRADRWPLPELVATSHENYLRWMGSSWWFLWEFIGFYAGVLGCCGDVPGLYGIFSWELPSPNQHRPWKIAQEEISLC